MAELLYKQILKNQTSLLRYGSRIVERETAEDALQDLLLKAWKLQTTGEKGLVKHAYRNQVRTKIARKVSYSGFKNRFKGSIEVAVVQPMPLVSEQLTKLLARFKAEKPVNRAQMQALLAMAQYGTITEAALKTGVNRETMKTNYRLGLQTLREYAK